MLKVFCQAKTDKGVPAQAQTLTVTCIYVYKTYGC